MFVNMIIFTYYINIYLNYILHLCLIIVESVVFLKAYSSRLIEQLWTSQKEFIYKYKCVCVCVYLYN